MSTEQAITAYSVAVPKRQTQNLLGLDKHIRPGIEYVQQECWDNEGKPYLRMYTGREKLQGKYTLITGVDSSIGRATATMFAIEGHRGIEDAKAAMADIAMYGCDVNLVALDLQREADCKRLVESHMAKFGHLNVLVNNASKQIMEEHIERIDLDKFRSSFESDIIQMIAVTKYAVPHLKRGSSTINTTSVVAYAGSPRLVDYSATKGAIMSFTRFLPKQLAPKGIRVNAVAQRPVVTALQPVSKDPEDMEGFGVGSPMHSRATQPVELGPAFVFLASADSNVMTGACMHVNNGLHVGGS